MAARVKTVAWWVFGLVVAAVLAMGAQAAFAKPVTATCPFEPPDHVGACSSQQECQDLCDFFAPQGSTGVCSGGCCKCLL